MIDSIFGAPILKCEMPGHNEIKEQFSSFIKDSTAFQHSSSQWECNCETTHNSHEENNQLPWDIFYENVQGPLQAYLNYLGMAPDDLKNLSGTAWANKYSQHQHQDVHSHGGGNNLVSCAYVLDLPDNDPDCGQFMFYNSALNWFPTHITERFYGAGNNGKLFNPLMQEGDIVFYFFAAKGRIAHTGIVVDANSNNDFKTVEGNTSSGLRDVVDRDGQGVYMKQRSISSLGLFGGVVRLPY